MEVLTRKGTHAYFALPQTSSETSPPTTETATEVRTRIRPLALPIDFLSGNRFALGPGSVLSANGFTYTLREGKAIVPATDLPLFPAEILQEKKTPKPSVVSGSQKCDGPIRDIHAYLCRIPSVQGSNGSRGFMRACFVVLDQKLDMVSALAALEKWNDEGPIVPKWSREEIIRAYQNAIRRRIGSVLGNILDGDQK